MRTALHVSPSEPHRPGCWSVPDASTCSPHAARCWSFNQNHLVKNTYANARLLYSHVLVVTQAQQTDGDFSVDSWFCCFVVVINCWLRVGIVRHCVGVCLQAGGPIDAKRFDRLMECSYIYKPVPHTL